MKTHRICYKCVQVTAFTRFPKWNTRSEVRTSVTRYVSVIVGFLVTLSFGLHAQESIAKDTERRDRAFLILATARTEAAKLEPPSQATILYLTGRSAAKYDSAQAKRDLQQAFDLIRRSDEVPGWNAIASSIVTQTVALSPDYVEANLPTETAFRETALSRLVAHKIANHDLKGAIALQKRMTSELGGYIAARELLQALPKSADAERADIFANLLLNYRQAAHPYSTIGYPEDFSTVIVRFWQQLPRGLVREAAEEVLKQAAEKTASNAEAIAASSPSGTIMFSSAYEFRAFQMLPILKAIDPTRAESLEKELQKVRELLSKYPQGQQSLDPTLRSTPLEDGEVRQVRYIIVPKPGTAPQPAATLEIDRVARQMEAQLKDKPAEAIATAASMADPNERGASLIRIAKTLAESQPDLAAAALNKLLESRELRPVRNSGHFIQGADILVTVNRFDDAKKLLNAALVEVRKAYDEDHDPDNPNRALKLFWGSTHGWRDIIAVAAKISNQDALDVIKDIPDEEIQSIERVMLAGIWLDVPVWRGTSPMVSKNKN